MKKLKLTLIVMGIAMVALTSCKKSETLLTPSYAYEMQANHTYVFALPTNTDDEFIISTNPEHAAVSQLGVDSAGNKIYTYTPTKDYVGTDHIVLSTVEGQHIKHGPTPADSTAGPRPRCKPKCIEKEYDYKITIDFTIVPEQI